MDERNHRIKQFYARLWFGDASVADARDTHPPWEVADMLKCKYTVMRQEIVDFCRTVGNNSDTHVDRGQKTLQAPMDFAIVVGWKVLSFHGWVKG